MRRVLIKVIRLYTFYCPLRLGKIPLLRIFSKVGLFKNISIIGTFGNHTKAEFNISDWVQQLVYFFGTYINEETSIRIWKHYVRESKVIIDVGANFGFYSLLSAGINPNAKIYAFEPSPYILKSFTRNIELNLFRNIHLQSLGVGDKDGKFKLFVSDDDNTGMSSLVDRGEYSRYTVDVSVVTLDGFTRSNSIDTVDLVKIDVEGNEFNVLIGMNEILKVYKPAIFIELLNDTLKNFGHDIQVIFDYLTELGYLCYEFDKYGNSKVLSMATESGLAIFIHESKAAVFNKLKNK